MLYYSFVFCTLSNSCRKADYDTMVMAIRTLMGYQPENDVHNEESSVELSEHENIIAQPHPVAPVAAVQLEER